MERQKWQERTQNQKPVKTVRVAGFERPALFAEMVVLVEKLDSKN